MIQNKCYTVFINYHIDYRIEKTIQKNCSKLNATNFSLIVRSHCNYINPSEMHVQIPGNACTHWKPRQIALK